MNLLSFLSRVFAPLCDGALNTQIKTHHTFALKDNNNTKSFTRGNNNASILLLLRTRIMRERSESRERNDDWNRDEKNNNNDDDHHRRVEKIPIWTRRRPTGFDVMPEGKHLFYSLSVLTTTHEYLSSFIESSQKARTTRTTTRTNQT
jgi:hypothetical protein